MDRLHPQHVDLSDLSLEALESFGNDLANYQRGVNFWIGDLAIYAEKHYPNSATQVWPEWISPGLVDRCKAVAQSYPPSDRNPDATWTQHMREARHHDRVERVRAHVEAGRTSDEARTEPAESRWLLAIDVHYYLHRFWFSGAGVEAALGVAQWVERTVERLKKKGVTDVACCFDSKRNDRKKLDDTYKDRPPKDPELGNQLKTVWEMLTKSGFCCVKIEGQEADDCLASYAAQFKGRVTILTQDKDCRQCLSDKCNMLLDVEWNEDETTGEHVPTYKWLSAKQHTESTGIPPRQWPEFQCLMGDSVDGIKGAVGIGEVTAKKLIQEFGNADVVVAAAKAHNAKIRAAQCASLIEFADKLEVTRQLVTLRTDLELPTNTRI